MLEEIIKAQEDNSLTINYNKWIFESIQSYVGNRVMDVGAGRGNFLQYLINKESIIAIDVLDVFVDNLRRTYGSQGNVHIFKWDIQDDNIIGLSRSYGIDTVICNNVLEHVRDDLKALHNISAILGEKGKLILILPAFQFVYNEWDKAVGHFRRYNYKNIKDKLKKANFKVYVNFYINAAGLLGWFLNGKILKNTPAKNNFIERQAVFFDCYMVKWLRIMEKAFRPSFGQSLIIIAEHV